MQSSGRDRGGPGGSSPKGGTDIWNPSRYLHFAGERSRPFFELVGRIDAERPALVYDLGCGPGQLTATLADRWPDAMVHGIDSSMEMIASGQQIAIERASTGAAVGATGQAANGGGAGSLDFSLGDVRDWLPDAAPDVIVSNAVLQWVPGHEGLLVNWAGQLAPGGWLAFQVPGNFDQPTHAILASLVTSQRWRGLLPGVQLNRQAGDPAQYLDLLARAGCSVDAWETTYLHVLQGDDPVTDWYSGSGMRPVLSALDAEQAAEFTAEYSARARAAYPAAEYGTVLPFRRVFVAARRG
jgi:trans-aconitate 2-methyltransferase